jgi:hypothetical protein
MHLTANVKKKIVFVAAVVTQMKKQIEFLLSSILHSVVYKDAL